MIGNPIVGKELVTVLRSRGAFVLAVMFVTVLSLLALSIWPSSEMSIQRAALHARLFLAMIFSGQLVMLALFAPPFAATGITAERESHTWETLYYSLLRPDQILIGKLVGAIAFLLILMLLSLPTGAVCILLGGVTLREFFLSYLVLMMAGLSFGLIGLTTSAYVRSSYISLFLNT